MRAGSASVSDWSRNAYASRSAGYRRLTLWTQADLHAARRLYARQGFRRVATQRHRSFGKRLVAETWELALVPR